MEKMCGKCRQIKPTTDFFKRSRSADGLQRECKSCCGTYITEYTRLIVEKLKEKVFKKLGHVCVRCGFQDKRALQIDHVKGDGFKTRRKISQVEFLKLVLADESNAFQILCANCNWIKRHENGEHMRVSSSPNRL